MSYNFDETKSMIYDCAILQINFVNAFYGILITIFGTSNILCLELIIISLFLNPLCY